MRFALTFMLILLYCCTNSQQSAKDQKFQIAFYNVENLFDTMDDPEKKDDDFLPGGSKEWTEERYTKKINDLSKVIKAMNPTDFPDIVGFAEVENVGVLFDLTKSEHLKEARYTSFLVEGKDERGIDVGLIYRSTFKLLQYESIEVVFPFDPQEKTRDILYVKGKVYAKGTLHLFFNHWPSRRSEEKYRIEAAKVLKKKVDEILAEDPNANIVIMGDLNDYPNNKSVAKVLKASPRAKKSTRLFNLAYVLHREGKGTYNYKGNWGMLDQMIVSGSLLKKGNGLYLATPKMYIFREEWMMYESPNGDKFPSRTYGKKYYGGYSDHLPIYVDLVVE